MKYFLENFASELAKLIVFYLNFYRKQEVQWDEYVKQFNELNFNIVARPFMITNSLTSHLSTIQLDLRSFLETGFQPGSLNQHCTYEHKDRLEAAEQKLIEQKNVERLYRKQSRGYKSAKTGNSIINRMVSIIFFIFNGSHFHKIDQYLLFLLEIGHGRCTLLRNDVVSQTIG